MLSMKELMEKFLPGLVKNNQETTQQILQPKKEEPKQNISNFDKIQPFVLVHEGGYSNDPVDPGGATNKGICLRFLKSTGDLALGDVDKDGDIDIYDIKQLDTEEEVNPIYKKYFWDKYDLDDFSDNIKLQYALYDMTVNAGPGTSFKLLQRVLNKHGANLKVDGVFGKNSKAAYEKFKNISGLENEYLNERLIFYNDLVAAKPQFKKFIKGWINRVNAVKSNFSKL